MRANEEQAGSRKLPTLGQALLWLQCPFVGWKGRHDLEKGEEKKMQTVLDEFFFFFFFSHSLLVRTCRVSRICENVVRK